MGEVRNKVNRVYTGCLNGDGREKTTYTGLEEREPLIRCGTVFFVNPQNLGPDYLGFWDC